MHPLRSAVLAAAVVLALAAPALSQQAQDRSSRGPGFDRYISASAGAAFANETTPTFVGEYGEMVGDHVIAYLAYSYSENLMSTQMQYNLALAGNVLTSATGYQRSFSGNDRGLALTLGGKFVMPVSRAFRPYVGAGAGGLHLRRSIREESQGDVTSSFVTESGLNDGLITSGAVASVKPLAEGLVGVNVIKGRTYVDVGYRYRRAFHAQQLQFSQFAVGVGVTF